MHRRQIFRYKCPNRVPASDDRSVLEIVEPEIDRHIPANVPTQTNLTTSPKSCPDDMRRRVVIGCHHNVPDIGDDWEPAIAIRMRLTTIVRKYLQPHVVE